MPLLDYDYGSALGSNRVHPRSELAIKSALVRGNSPMNSLGLRTEVMLDCLEPLTTLADPTAAKAIWDGWSDLPPPLVGRHPGDEEEELPEEEIDGEETLDGDDFDDDEEEEEFDDEEFDDEDEEDIDEELDDEIDDIDVDDDEEDDFEDDEDLDELDEEEEDELEDI
jgi:hypothetical protein